MTTEATLPTESAGEPRFEIADALLEEILQPNEVLATAWLDRQIQAGEENPDADPEELTLMRFQRTLVNMDKAEARTAALKFAEEAEKYATVAATSGDRRIADLHYPLARGLIVRDFADNERWRIIGVDPLQNGDNPLNRSIKNGVEQSWADVMRSRQAIADAQAEQARNIEEISRLIPDLLAKPAQPQLNVRPPEYDMPNVNPSVGVPPLNAEVPHQPAIAQPGSDWYPTQAPPTNQ